MSRKIDISVKNQQLKPKKLTRKRSVLTRY